MDSGENVSIGYTNDAEAWSCLSVWFSADFKWNLVSKAVQKHWQENIFIQEMLIRWKLNIWWKLPPWVKVSI